MKCRRQILAFCTYKIITIKFLQERGYCHNHSSHHLVHDRLPALLVHCCCCLWLMVTHGDVPLADEQHHQDLSAHSGQVFLSLLEEVPDELTRFNVISIVSLTDFQLRPPVDKVYTAPWFVVISTSLRPVETIFQSVLR